MTSNYLSQAIDRFGDDYVRSDDELMYNCPFCESIRHKADNDHKLYVNISKGLFHCFKCGSRGKLFSTENLLSTDSLVSDIEKYFRGSDSSEYEDDNMFYVPDVKLSVGTSAYEYCIKRGITDEKIDYYNIRLGIDGMFGRIVIPNIIFGNRGVWTDMFSARTYIDQTPKYKNPYGAKKTDSVFNIHRIKEGCENLYGVEGAVTAICAGYDAVAFYGCHPSDQQISAVAEKRPRNFYAILDNDEAGRTGNINLARRVSNLISGNVYVVYMPEGKDAADLGEQEFLRYVMNNKIAYRSDAYRNIIEYFN